MKHGAWGFIGALCLAGLFGLAVGCAGQDTGTGREDQVSGYVPPEKSPEQEAQEREAVRPSVPRIYW